MVSSSWKVPPLWGNDSCWIIGGGPSILKQFNVPDDIAQAIQKREVPLNTLSKYMAQIHNDHCIGVNTAYSIGTWIDFNFFGDFSWYLAHEEKLHKHPGTPVSCNARFEHSYYGVKYLRKEKRFGLSNKNGFVCWNGNSGGAAINLALHLGVKEIRLLGFDMDVGANQYTHWHGYHEELAALQPKGTPRKGTKLPYERHLRCFSRIAEDAKRFNIRILNCNPDSKITEFEKVSLEEL